MPKVGCTFTMSTVLCSITELEIYYYYYYYYMYWNERQRNEIKWNTKENANWNNRQNKLQKILKCMRVNEIKDKYGKGDQISNNI